MRKRANILQQGFTWQICHNYKGNWREQILVMKEEWVKERNRRFDNGSTRGGNEKEKQQEGY